MGFEMGRRGPKPKPAHLKILGGNPGNKPLHDGSPQVASGIPRCPTRFDGVSRHLWKSLGRKLAKAGILTLLDIFALEMLVDAYMEYHAAIASENETRTEKAQKHLRTMLREFGLTPASRSSVKAAQEPEAKKQADPASQYFA
jgi:phage terminase small subunit